ncbi:hypothetical protein CEXT_238711 [Caerostris extrusa]|uniref:Uncharacterized protein n=1 Tax=Caerostris extrusa TaxID=172846 RepID=A0AAV4PW59_CAEEX|nr:hypothetical protein CEXT_238711 [Caerostris extrusa]
MKRQPPREEQQQQQKVNEVQSLVARCCNLLNLRHQHQVWKKTLQHYFKPSVKWKLMKTPTEITKVKNKLERTFRKKLKRSKEMIMKKKINQKTALQKKRKENEEKKKQMKEE